MEKKTGHEITEKPSPHEAESTKPTPDNFDAYLPWACYELEVYIDIALIKIKHNEYVSTLTDRSKTTRSKTRRKHAQSRTDLGSNDDFKQNVMNSKTNVDNVKIYTVYDSSNNLVQIKFDNNRKIPGQLLQIIRLIVQFQTHLTNITINRGLNKATIHELHKLLQSSHITDVCLDNTVVADANYDLLLDNPLRLFSLSRCKIDDTIVKKIVSKLSYPLVASKTLSILNLASNRITDAGAKYIANMLRSNRQLVYLNLSDNSITDEGSVAILDVLKEFFLSEEELISSKYRFMQYWHDKQKILSEEKLVEERKVSRRKSVKASTAPKSVIKKSTTDFDNFVDPFSLKNTTVKNGHRCCYGNNQLSYLNLSYNNLSYFTVKTLVAVLKTQMVSNRVPRGLINLSIEGNCIPTNCMEMNQISGILETILAQHYKNYSQFKKKAQTKMGL